MTLTTLSPIARVSIASEELVAQHPPRITDANKALIHSIACPKGALHRGQLEASRWAVMPLPEIVHSALPKVTLHPRRYDYPPTQPGDVAWHVNFADEDLFYGYGSGLFAQDEMQAAEHPILGSLRELLLAAPVPGFPPLTLEGGRASPVLVMGALRACAIDTEVSSGSIYGSAMKRASAETIREAVKPLKPWTPTQIIAMAAIAGGRGRYTPEEIRTTVETATTAFSAARLESLRYAGKPVRTVIHTGFWGCGAFAGNRTMMSLLQLVSARLAQVDELVFHAFNENGVKTFREAALLFAGQIDRGSLSDFLGYVHRLGLEWGSSDGN